MKDINTIIEFTLPLSRHDAYKFFIDEDFVRNFENFFFIPGVIAAKPDKEWSRPGDTRTIYFDNATVATEKRLVMIPGLLLVGSIYGFTSFFLQKLVTVKYQLTFYGIEGEGTRVETEITLTVTKPLYSFIFRVLLRRCLKGYLNKSLKM
jgi:hypothetical protein